MSYKCENCGHIFEEGEQTIRREKWGEYYGGLQASPIGIQEFHCCPMCGCDSFEETVPCARCKSEHLISELVGDVCQECIDECRHDFNACYAVSFGDTQTVEINALLASIFDKHDIEAILVEYILKSTDIDFSAYIDRDPDWFGERLAEEVRKNDSEKF